MKHGLHPEVTERKCNFDSYKASGLTVVSKHTINLIQDVIYSIPNLMMRRSSLYINFKEGFVFLVADSLLLVEQKSINHPVTCS